MIRGMSFDFDAVVAPFRMQPGLRRLAAGAAQLTPTCVGDRALQEKLGVLSDHAAQALLLAPGFDPVPALVALCEQAAAEHPTAFSWNGEQAGALHLGWAVQGESLLPLAGEHAAIGACLAALPAPWRLAGLLALAFAEDFAVMDAASGSIPWLAVCLPSHWSPEEKIGRGFAEIHAPVADNSVLIAAGAHLMRLVTAPDRWERFVWTVTPHALLDGHPRRNARAHWPDGATPAEIARLAFWRTERQTFIPMPERRQAVFTIHVEVEPLTVAIDTTARAARLRDALASMSQSVLAYRGLSTARERLVVWLGERAGA